MAERVRYASNDNNNNNNNLASKSKTPEMAAYEQRSQADVPCSSQLMYRVPPYYTGQEIVLHCVSRTRTIDF